MSLYLCLHHFPLSSQALTPLCEDDNQSMEIIQRLQKNLDILTQSMTRVSSRSEMLGAIHQVGLCCQHWFLLFCGVTAVSVEVCFHCHMILFILIAMIQWSLVNIRRVVLVRLWR